MKLCEIAMTCVVCLLFPTSPLPGDVGEASVNEIGRAFCLCFFSS